MRVQAACTRRGGLKMVHALHTLHTKSHHHHHYHPRYRQGHHKFHRCKATSSRPPGVFPSSTSTSNGHGGLHEYVIGCRNRYTVVEQSSNRVNQIRTTSYHLLLRTNRYLLVPVYHAQCTIYRSIWEIQMARGKVAFARQHLNIEISLHGVREVQFF